MNPDENPQMDHSEEIAGHARLTASLRMVGLAAGVILGMVAGVTLDSILLGAALGIGVGLGGAFLLDRITKPRGL